MHTVVTNETASYSALKVALIKIYGGRTLDQAQEDLVYAPPLGDKMPSEMLAQFRRILGRHPKQNPLLIHSLKREFLARLPYYARDPLIVMGNSPYIDEMAEHADALVQERKRRRHRDTIHSSSLTSDKDVQSHTLNNFDTPVMAEMLRVLNNINTKLNPDSKPTHGPQRFPRSLLIINNIFFNNPPHFFAHHAIHLHDRSSLATTLALSFKPPNRQPHWQNSP